MKRRERWWFRMSQRGNERKREKGRKCSCMRFPASLRIAWEYFENILLFCFWRRSRNYIALTAQIELNHEMSKRECTGCYRSNYLKSPLYFFSGFIYTLLFSVLSRIQEYSQISRYHDPKMHRVLSNLSVLASPCSLSCMFFFELMVFCGLLSRQRLWILRHREAPMRLVLLAVLHLSS